MFFLAATMPDTASLIFSISSPCDSRLSSLRCRRTRSHKSTPEVKTYRTLYVQLKDEDFTVVAFPSAVVQEDFQLLMNVSMLVSSTIVISNSLP